MRNSYKLLIVQAILVFFMVIFTDWTNIPKYLLAFLWSMWTFVVAIMYAVAWREEVGCTCLERSEEE